MIQITFTPESAEEAAIIGEAMSRIMAISAQQMSITPAETKEPVAEAPKRTRATKATTAANGATEPAGSQSNSGSAAATAATSETTNQPDPTPTATTVETEDPKPAAEPSAQEAPAAQTVSSPAPSVSLEEVRAKLAELSQAGKQQQVVALIASMGARKLTEIPAEKYASLMAQAEAL